MGLSKNIRVFSMVLSCLGGCSSQEGPLYAPPEFGCERSGKFELLTGELPVGNVTDIWEYGPVLIVQGSGGGFLFHVFDKRSGEPLCGTEEVRGRPCRSSMRISEKTGYSRAMITGRGTY